ncbi:hypothetical protein AB4Z40_26675 [Bosea sp. 2YAB26]|uniref:hypothetical protein n=1 Tax=Bosea sp. 2YAB26 TaxID=3237478 RepID=UPI003F928503
MAILLDAVLGLMVEFILQIIGYLTGKTLIRGLTLGRLAIGDYGRRPFSLYWRVSGRTVLSGDLAILIGWGFWLVLAITSIVLFRQSIPLDQ